MDDCNDQWKGYICTDNTFRAQFEANKAVPIFLGANKEERSVIKEYVIEIMVLKTFKNLDFSTWTFGKVITVTAK